MGIELFPHFHFKCILDLVVYMKKCFSGQLDKECYEEMVFEDAKCLSDHILCLPIFWWPASEINNNFSNPAKSYLEMHGFKRHIGIPTPAAFFPDHKPSWFGNILLVFHKSCQSLPNSVVSSTFIRSTFKNELNITLWWAIRRSTWN